MKLNGKIKKSFVIACALLMFLSSCKKEESSTSTTKGTMNGTLTFNLPEFIFSGETLELEATGINVPLKQDIKWFIPVMYGSADTVFANPIRVQFPDSLGTFHISCMALADSYWIVSTYKETTTIDTSLFYGSLEGREFDLDSYIVDPRDGRRYFTTEVGNLEWFAENLAYEGAGAYYKTSPVMQHLFGRYYSWDEATGGVSADGLAEGPQGVCPPGWHIPTNTDWEDLGMWLNDGEPVAFDDKWPELGSRASVEVYLNYE
ncbi:MAG: hypothetical protein HUJ90_02970, partial [Bacteroidales bacterium]|nr:hypothetical protein [Bacteroidales bacterium]